jgi:hypothetical protein
MAKIRDVEKMFREEKKNQILFSFDCYLKLHHWGALGSNGF